MAGQGRRQSKWTEGYVDMHEARAVRALDRAQTESGGLECRIRWTDRSLGVFVVEVNRKEGWVEWKPKSWTT